MALIKCPECKKEVSDKAFVCPNCGYPLQVNSDDITMKEETGFTNNNEKSEEENSLNNPKNVEWIPQSEKYQKNQSNDKIFRLNDQPINMTKIWNKYRRKEQCVKYIRKTYKCDKKTAVKMVNDYIKQTGATEKMSSGVWIGLIFIFLCIVLAFCSDSSDENKNDNEQESVENTESMQAEGNEEAEINNPSQTEEFNNAVEAIGMNPDNVKNIKSLDDWASGTRFNFVYDGFTYIVYALGNGEIKSIETEYQRIKIFERGFEPLNYKDFEPDKTIIDSITDHALEVASQYIENAINVKDSSFTTEVSRIYDYYIVTSDMKAKNLADKETFRYTVHFLIKDGQMETKYVSIDGKTMYGSEDEMPSVEKKEIANAEDVSDNNMILLQYGVEGNYGSRDFNDDDNYIRYHVPSGQYTIKCNIRGGFYIETDEIHIEDGEEIADIVEQYNMSEGDTIDITIEDGQCISLILNTELELIKK